MNPDSMKCQDPVKLRKIKTIITANASTEGLIVVNVNNNVNTSLILNPGSEVSIVQATCLSIRGVSEESLEV